MEEAVERAIRECIQEDILKDFLEKHRAEAKEMSIFEYDQEKHMRQEREAAWEAGRNSGLEEGKMQTLQALVCKKLDKGRSIAEIAADLEETEECIRKIIDEIK